jgi:hypothetical protein
VVIVNKCKICSTWCNQTCHLVDKIILTSSGNYNYFNTCALKYLTRRNTVTHIEAYLVSDMLNVDCNISSTFVNDGDILCQVDYTQYSGGFHPSSLHIDSFHQYIRLMITSDYSVNYNYNIRAEILTKSV